MKKDFEKWALKQLGIYHKLLLLTDHLLSFEYEKDMGVAAMQHNFSYPYKTTPIMYGDYALGLWKDGKKEELRKILIHELCHSITDPFYSKAIDRHTGKADLEDERERVTDHIANIITKMT